MGRFDQLLRPVRPSTPPLRAAITATGARGKVKGVGMAGLARQTTLSKEASQVFNMTLDELQNTVGSGKPFGSMNMVRLLQVVKGLHTTSTCMHATLAGANPYDSS